MNDRDVVFIKRIVKYITDNVDYGDITELSEKLNVDEYWLSEYLPNCDEDADWEE